MSACCIILCAFIFNIFLSEKRWWEVLKVWVKVLAPHTYLLSLFPHVSNEDHKIHLAGVLQEVK